MTALRRLFVGVLLASAASSAWAMPPLLAAVAVLFVEAALPLGMATLIGLGTITIGSVIFASTLVYGIVDQRRQAKKARNAYNASLTDRYAPIMNAGAAPWQVIYGECPVGPVQIAAQLTSGARDEFKHVVYVWAAHECDAITDTLINGVSAGTLDANGWVTSGKFFKGSSMSDNEYKTLNGSGAATLSRVPTGGVFSIGYNAGGSGDLEQYVYLTPADFTVVGSTVTVNAGFVATWASRGVVINYGYTSGASLLRVRHHLGSTTQTADTALMADCPADWTSADRLRGLCYSIVTFCLDEPEFQGGPPDVKVRARGKKLYDHRSGSTVWSANAALATADFLRGEYGKRATTNQMGWTAIDAAANACDEALATHGGAARYTANGAFRTDMDPDSTLDALCQAMAGFVTWDGTWGMQAGVYSAPVLALTDADNAGSVEVVADKPGDEVFNGLRGRFFDPDRYDQLTDYTPYINTAFSTADGGDLWDDLDLPFSNVHWRAHNLARIQVERSRGMQIVYPAKLSAIKLKPGQRVTLTCSFLGIVSSVFRVVKREYRAGQPVLLTLQQDDPTMYDEADAPTPLDSPASAQPDPFYVALVAGLVATSGDAQRQTLADGTVISRVRVSVTASTDALVTSNGALQVEYRLENATSWQRAPEAPGSTSEVMLQGMKDGRRYMVRARWRNSLGALGDWRMVDVLVQAKTAAPSNVTGMGSAVNKGRISWTWYRCPDADYGNTEVRTSDANWGSTSVQPVFRGKANGWQEVVATAATYTRYAKHFDTSGNASATAASDSQVVTAGDLVQDGVDGVDGLNNALVYIYKRSASAPTLPSATTTYTFATGALTGLNNGWTQTLPSGTNPLYASLATASNSGTTDTIAPGEWATPVVLAQDGVDGVDGLNAATVYLFQRTSSPTAPALPSTSTTYTFATGVATGMNNGWTQSMPTGGGAYRWMTTGSALSSGTTDTIAPAEWAAAAAVSMDGKSVAFFDAFDSGIDPWLKYSGDGEVSVISVADSTSGGSAMRIGNNSGADGGRMWHQENIPYDPAALYRMRLRIKRTSGLGTLYAGVVGIGADGVTLVNSTGADSQASQFYIVLQNTPPTGSGWYEYVGYFSGADAVGDTTPKPDPAAPGKLHSDVRYFRPMFVVNYNDVTGSTSIDSVEIVRMVGTNGLVPGAATDIYHDAYDFGGAGYGSSSGAVARSFTITPASDATIEFTGSISAAQVYGDGGHYLFWRVTPDGGGATTVFNCPGYSTAKTVYIGTTAFNAVGGLDLLFELVAKRPTGNPNINIYGTDTRVTLVKR